ncbi:MAG: T9SS type A sorting domain-containing protein [Bacteroidota bacterium]
MKKIFTITTLVFAFAIANSAQGQKIKLDESSKAGSATKSEKISVPCQGSIHSATTDLKWRPILTKKIEAFEPKIPNEELIEQMKAEKLQQKIQSYKGELPENKSTNSIDPVVGTNYLGNENNGSSPLDNTIAISNGGWIVSVANCTIEYDNTSGATTYYNDLLTFLGDGTISGVCDPVVIYDAAADRFILFVQTSPITSDSKILVLFSKTNNPTDGWWYYKLTGNPLNNGEGFDYPKLAVSNNELYIAGNLFFEPAGSFDQAVLYQINKNSGYTGGSLTWQYWYNIAGTPFTLLPLSDGQGNNYGPGCYLVATDAGGSSNIKLYDLTDDMTGSPTLNLYNVSTTAYSPAGDAQQSGTSCLLSNGDCRTLSGFYLNGFIHFVFHSDIGSGWNGINYNRLNVGSKTNQSSMFGSAGSYDYSYPSVASFGFGSSDKSVLINFGRASSAIYPEIRVVNCDNGMNWSNSVLVKSSSSFVSYTSSTNERWGDYTGAFRKLNSSNPSVWISGSFGTTSNDWSAWNAEVHGGAGSGISSVATKEQFNLYPNPIIETFTIEFTLTENTPLEINIVDMDGKMVKELYHGNASQGDNNFSFNKANLAKGTYFLVIKSNSSILKNEKIIIAG